MLLLYKYIIILFQQYNVTHCALPKHASTDGVFSYTISYMLFTMFHCTMFVLSANSWWPPLKILTHQLCPHVPNWWRTVVLHLYLCMESWCMSVHMWALVLSTKMCLHTHTTGIVSSVAGQLNKPHHATLWVQWLFYVKFILSSHSFAARVVYRQSTYIFLANVEHFFLGSYLVLQDMKISP